MQKDSLIVSVCNFVVKYSIFALVFLVPIFFLPWTTDILDFNKQAILLLLVALALFATMLKILVLGKFEINKSPIHIAAGILFLAYLLATIFSVYRYGSFWGRPQQTSESLLTVSCLLIFYFLTSNIFSKKNVLTSIAVLSASAIIAELIGISHFFQKFLLPFEFAKSVAFNTVGSVGSLGFFAAILIPVAIASIVVSKKWQRFLFFVQLILSAFIIILINYVAIWWVVLAGSAAFLILGIIKRDIFDARWMTLPMFFLAVSLFFILLNMQINWLPQKPNEIFISHKASMDIATQTIKERPLLGSGPGTFAYDFSKFKNPDFNKTTLWNITFNRSSSKILTSLATLGILGVLALWIFWVLPVFVVIRSFVKKEAVEEFVPESKAYPVLLMGLFAALIAQILFFFLYNSNVVLDFVFFFTVATVVAVVSRVRKEYILKPSSLFALATTLIFTLIFIFGLGILILNGQKYLAEVSFSKGLAAYQVSQNSDGLKKLESAASLNAQSDIYFRQLSQAYLLTLQEQLQNATQSSVDGQKTQIQTLLANSVNAGKKATDLNPRDAGNWSSRGYVYQSLIGVLTNASAWAINSYAEALKLDPNNPYLFAQSGSVYFADALALSAEQSAQKKELLGKAQAQLEKAVELNPKYSDALYSLGIVYDQQGERVRAIDVFTTIQQLNPQNTDITKILENLKSGKSLSPSEDLRAENLPVK